MEIRLNFGMAVVLEIQILATNIHATQSNVNETEAAMKQTWLSRLV